MMFKPGDKIRRIKGSWKSVYEGMIVTFKNYDNDHNTSIKIFEFDESISYSANGFELVKTNYTFKIFI